MKVSKEDILAIIDDVGVETDITTIEEEMTWKEAGIDSLEVMNVFLRIEEKFGIKIPDEEVDELNTIQATLAYIRNK